MKHTYLPVEAVIDSVLPTRRWWPLQDPALAGPPGIQPPVHLCGTIKPENGPQVAAPLLGTAKWLILICSAHSALCLRGPPAQAHCLCQHSCKHCQHKGSQQFMQQLISVLLCLHHMYINLRISAVLSSYHTRILQNSSVLTWCSPRAAPNNFKLLHMCVCIIQIIDISNTQKLTEIMNK